VSLSATTFRMHRWLSWLIGVQVLIWVAGGVVFSLVPFESWVKGAATVKPPTVVLPVGWAERSRRRFRPQIGTARWWLSPRSPRRRGLRCA